MRSASPELFVLQAGVSAANLLSDDYAGARGWAPWSTAAHEALASDALAASHRQAAGEEALAALKLSPIDAVGVRTAAIVRIVGGLPTRGNELMQVATVLGWRDPITQVWAMQASQRSGEPDKVIQRADALYQQEQFLAPSLAILLQDAPNGPTSRALLQALAARPIWRAGFIKASADLPPDYVVKLSQIAAALNTGPAPLSVEEARPLFDRLLAAGDMARAQRLWAGVRRGGSVANGNFEELSARNGADVPSDWDVSDEDVATIAVLRRPTFQVDGRGLRISSAARVRADPLAAADADAGSYAADLSRAQRRRPRGRSSVGGSAARVQMSSQTSGEACRRAARNGKQFSGKFIVPIQDCPIQQARSGAAR